MDLTFYIIAVIVCVILSALFSGSETALLRLSSEKIQNDLDKNSKAGIFAAKELVKNPSKLLVTILLGNNIVNIFGAACASALGVYFFGEEKGLFISTVAMTVVVLIFSEILPKAVAAKNPAKVSYLFSLPLYLVHKLAFPAHFIYAKAIDPIVKRIAGKDQSPAMSAAETILRLAENLKVKKPDGSPLPIISSAASAGMLTAADIMIPRTEIFSYSKDVNLQDLEKQIAESRFTRAIIYDNSINEILGSVHLKDVVKLNNSKSPDINTAIKPVLSIAERAPILEVLPRMQKALVHIAIVQDEFQTTLGMITQEDILEEIVGEIRDEFDKEELKRIKKISSHKYEVLGTVSVHDFNRESQWGITAERGDTLSGLIFNTLGEPPKSGDFIEVGQFELRVKDLSGKRIARIEVIKKTEQN